MAQARPRGDDTAQATAETVRRQITQWRARTTGGYGPGASAAELASHMHQRPTLGAQPTIVEREQSQQQTDRERGDQTTAGRAFARQALPPAAGHRRHRGRPVIVVTVLVVTLLARRRARRRRGR